jgi:hypothetical protein
MTCTFVGPAGIEPATRGLVVEDVSMNVTGSHWSYDTPAEQQQRAVLGLLEISLDCILTHY